MINLKKLTIPLFVFATGASILVIEVLAIRILAPYYGNTIITFSSVISVVLLALSLGYFAGGKLADKYPKEKLFYSIIAVSGIILIFLHALAIIILPVLGYIFPLTWGPLFFSGVLFFAPNFLLAMLSPFAIKLQKMGLPESDIGGVSGQIFFWSTLGSIFGSLSAGFILIPNFGINNIIFSLGLMLFILGMTPLYNKNWKLEFLLAGIVVISFIVLIKYFFLNFSEFLQPFNGDIVYQKDSAYQKITVMDSFYGERPARFLIQDRNFSSAKFLDSPDQKDLAFDYTKYYILYQIFNHDLKQAFMIGGGAYSVPESLLNDFPGAQIDIAEIDPLIFEVGKKYFNVLENPRLHNFVADGRRLLHDSSKKYDFIFSDAYASYLSTPDHLTTKEFFRLSRNKLSDKGVFIANVVGSLSKADQNFLFSEIKTFKSVFENSYFFAVDSPQSTKVQNVIFVGINGNETIDFNSDKIAKNENETIRNLPSKIIDVSQLNLSKHPILTDDFAPVEYLLSKELKNLQ